MNSEIRTCQSCKKPFTVEPDDFDFYERMRVPPPTWCPECRMLRRMAWSGYRILYKRKCDFTGDDIITFHHPSTPYRTYRQDIWWSDKWDPKAYGREYNFSKPFFQQFEEFLRTVPLPSLHTDWSSMINSEYCNGASQCRNCYLCFMTGEAEDCAYTTLVQRIRDSLDCSFSNDLELGYEAVMVNRGQHILYSQDCEDSHHIYFSKDLIGCSYCIGCTNLRNKNYYIFNQPTPKEEFEHRLQDFDFGSGQNVENFQERARTFLRTHPRKAFQGRKNTNTSGDYILNSKNTLNSYMVNTGENVRYSQLLKKPSAYSYDHTRFGLNSEWIYESTWVGLNVNNLKFCLWDYNAHHLEYSFGCHGSENLFGCVGIRKGQYCILNKQYSREKYEEMVGRIKQHMQEMPYMDRLGREYRYGEFFPAELSLWTYNETTADEFFPKTKENALREGFQWRDPDVREYQPATTEIPDHIRDVTDDILKAILKCDQCGKNYLIIRMELEFYRRMSIPIPRRCPLCRDRARIKLLNPIKIYHRQCAKCGNDIETSYAPERPEIVYCETCYQNEVV